MERHMSLDLILEGDKVQPVVVIQASALHCGLSMTKRRWIREQRKLMLKFAL